MEDIKVGTIIHSHPLRDQKAEIQTVETNEGERQVQLIKFCGKFDVNPRVVYVSKSFEECLDKAMEEL